MLVSQLENILKFIPSGSNSKPFAIELASSEELIVKLNTDLTRHYLNRKNHCDYINLGCAAYVVWLYLKEEKILVKSIKLKKNEKNVLCLVLKIKTTSEELDTDLNLFIKKRKTHRTKFLNKSSTVEYSNDLFKKFEELFPEAQFNEVNIKIKHSDLINSDFKKYLIICEEYLWNHPQATKDILSDIRFNSELSSSEERKMPYQTFGLKSADIFFLKVMSRWPFIAKILIKLPLIKGLLTKFTVNNLENANFFLITSQNYQAINLLRSGAKAMDFWLQLEKHKYKAQPFSVASISLVDAYNGALPSNTSKRYLVFFENLAWALFRKEFFLKESEKPVWLFRFGKE